MTLVVNVTWSKYFIIAKHISNENPWTNSDQIMQENLKKILNAQTRVFVYFPIFTT